MDREITAARLEERVWDAVKEMLLNPRGIKASFL